MTNPEERALLKTKEYLERMAKGIALGVDKYLGVNCPSARIERATCRLGGDRSIH